jgi:hypothetical protein
MRHEDEVFVQDRIELGENEFRNCRFESCRLVYDGSPGVRIQNCEFEDTRLELTDEAGNTLSFLQNIFHGFGEDGQAVVENFFDQIREGRIGQPDTDGYPEP